jgi:hypothetical protein
MITVTIDFFNSKTEEHIESFKIELPDDIVFEAADSNDINYINARPFYVSERMKEYIVQQKPEFMKKFELCLHEFIGRHNLPPGY